MVGLRSLFKFYINSSLHVSLAILSFTIITYIEFDIPIDPWVLVFIFLASITGYNFIKYAGIAKLHHFSLTRNLKQIQIFSFVVFMGLLASIFYQSLAIIGIAVLMGSLTLLYALPVFDRNKNLRGIPGMKIYVIAFVVTGVILFMPLADHPPLNWKEVIIGFLQRFCLIIALILPFEIRDLKFDMAQLGTIPQKLGVRKTKYLGYILLIFTVLMEFFKDFTITVYGLSLIAISIIAAYALSISKINQHPYFSSFWVESIPVFWLIILILFKAIF